MDNILNILNANTFFGGCAMFVMNIGGKYIASEIPDTLDHYFTKYKFFRYLVVFSIAFISTRNIKMSILLTLTFILLFKFLIETKSKFCILKKENIPEKNNDLIEYQNALQTIKKYNNRL